MTEPPTETENLVVVVPDALRADHWPALPGTTVDAIASGPYTPVCLPTLVSGVSAQSHGRQWFDDAPIAEPVVYDLEQEGYDVAYWDSPEDAVRPLTRAPPHTPLRDMDPPFVFIARLLWTHTPYNLQWDVNDANVGVSFDPDAAREYPAIDGGDDGQDYIDMMVQGDVDFQADYAAAVEKTRERILHWRDVLRDRGLYEDTTFIVEADHGEAWGGPLGVDVCRHVLHSHTTCNRVMEIRATILDRDLDVDGPLQQKDTLALWDDRWAGGRHDLEPIQRDHDQETDEVKERLRHLGYL